MKKIRHSKGGRALNQRGDQDYSTSKKPHSIKAKGKGGRAKGHEYISPFGLEGKGAFLGFN